MHLLILDLRSQFSTRDWYWGENMIDRGNGESGKAGLHLISDSVQSLRWLYVNFSTKLPLFGSY